MMNFIWENAEKVGALATAGAFIATFINGVFQEMRFRKQLKQQREQWLNDAFVKEEAQLWIEYREKFIELSLEFTDFIKYIKPEVKSIYSEQNPLQEIAEFGKKSNALNIIATKIKPYLINKELKLLNKKAKTILAAINNFSVQVEVCTQINWEDEWFEKDETFDGYNIIGLKTIKKSLIEGASDAKLIKTELSIDNRNMNEILFESPNLINLFKQEIDSTNEALNEKVTAHLKKQ